MSIVGPLLLDSYAENCYKHTYIHTYGQPCYLCKISFNFLLSNYAWRKEQCALLELVLDCYLTLASSTANFFLDRQTHGHFGFL